MYLHKMCNGKQDACKNGELEKKKNVLLSDEGDNEDYTSCERGPEDLGDSSDEEKYAERD